MERIQKRWNERVKKEDLSIEHGHASDADIAVLERHSPDTFGDIHWKIIEASQSTEVVLDNILRALKSSV